jgi:hypothetical protein
MGMMSVIKILGHLKFMSHSLKLPVQKAASGVKEGFKESTYGKRKDYGDNKTVSVSPQIPIPFFQPVQGSETYHLDTCGKIGKNYQDFHDSMLDAIEFAHNQWKLQCKFKDIKVMSVSAIGTPGCLDGPELESLIKNAPACASMTGNMKKHRDAVATGVSKCFKKWQDKVMIPGLPLWPAFAAFPGPMAPPMPCVPVPLIACPSAMMTEIFMGDSMKKAMGDALDGGLKDKDPEKHYEALHDAIATAASIAFLIWNASQMVSLVLGKGPIPTFAPPIVPVGPVVGGDNIAAPGHLMA